MGQMEVFSQDYEHEQVVYCRDQATGLKAIIAIHNSHLGPALGGLRVWNYSHEDEALEDVLRLSQGMTYKASIAGLNLGGGKAVIIADPKKHKSETLFRSFGSFVQSLGGRYITAEDVGTDVQDMEYISMETDYVVGLRKTQGGSGDPSPWTARGVVEGTRAAVEYRLDKKNLSGLKIAVQGAGHVGYHLINNYVSEGCHVYTCDIDKTKTDQFIDNSNVTIVGAHEIYDTDADIFCPSALGAVINPETIDRLKCKIVAGSANNQLATPECGDELYKRKITYAPDYAINAGGLMNVSIELEGYNEPRAMKMIRRIYYIMRDIFKHSAQESLPEYKCADRVAAKRIEEVSRIRARYQGKKRRSLHA